LVTLLPFSLMWIMLSATSHKQDSTVDFFILCFLLSVSLALHVLADTYCLGF
jgi:hypothetical protein